MSHLAPNTLTSPCTGVCKLDAKTGWCLGCARNGSEIAQWRTETAQWRGEVWADIPRRMAELGVAGRRLPWDTSEIRDFAVQTLKAGTGTWLMGVVGAVAEFVPVKGRSVIVTARRDTITATTENGAIQLQIDDDVRALTFDPPQTSDAERRIVLAVKKDRRNLPVATTVTDLGNDPLSLHVGPEERLYDLGLGRREARFCVRCQNGPAQDALRLSRGRSFFDALPAIGPALMAENPIRVIETCLGRIEVSGAIPPPDGMSPDGPHTHLLPDHLATGRALPVGMDLPPSYFPGAVFYPAPKATNETKPGM